MRRSEAWSATAAQKATFGIGRINHKASPTSAYPDRPFGNYLGDSNEAQHLANLTAIAAQATDPAAASLARRLANFFDRNTDNLRARQGQVDNAYGRAIAFDAGIADEL